MTLYQIVKSSYDRVEEEVSRIGHCRCRAHCRRTERDPMMGEDIGLMNDRGYDTLAN